MTPDAAPASHRPAASLTSVRVTRRSASAAPSGKAGDLTAGAALPPPKLLAAIPFSSEPMLPEREPGPASPAPDPPLLPIPPAPPPALAPPPAPAAAEAEPSESEPEQEREPRLLAAPVLTTPDAEPMRHADAEPERHAEVEPERAVRELAEVVPLIPLVEAELVAPVPAQPQHARRGAPGADDMIDYWDGLRGGRDLPPLEDLDRVLVAERWPNSVLLSFAAGVPRMTRLGESSDDVEFTGMVTDWLLSHGRQSAKRLEPVDEEHHFPATGGRARYRLLLLPLGRSGTPCEQVLCHVSRLQELSAAAAFKRWLAS
jgi:hypothetical protein